MRERRRNYDFMFIISPLHAKEEDLAVVIERVSQAVQAAGGEVMSINHNPPWGRRKLAYPIRDYAGGEASRRNFTEGFYVLMHFVMASTKVVELDRAIKLIDPILRHLITVVERKPQLLDAESSEYEEAEVDQEADDYIDDGEEELVEESDE